MLALYSLTIFHCAGLLFVVQPLYARLVLPLLGGSPAVWNTVVLFFQSALLLGYAYAHLVSRWPARRQMMLHGIVLVLPLALLPIRLPVSWQPPVEGNPAWWLLGVMLVTVGPPFFALSTASPLLQRWFSRTGHHHAADPYFLYAASNAGSMLGLLGYLLLLEPTLTLGRQSWGWSGAYLVAALLTIWCGAAVWTKDTSTPGSDMPNPETAPAPAPWRFARWMLLAFVPSSLMLSVTAYISTDIAAVPLLWVVPLMIYLLTFIVVFARRPLIPAWLPLLLLLPCLIWLGRQMMVEVVHPLKTIPLHLAALFLTGLVFHGELVQDRPAAIHLTRFYLALSIGGALGGLFNAILAPAIFKDVVEYPVTLMLAGLLGLVLLLREEHIQDWLDNWKATQWLSPDRWPSMLTIPLVLVILGTVAYRVNNRWSDYVLLRTRTFFGIYSVHEDKTYGFRSLWHGTTIHGGQMTAPANRKLPTTYFHPRGPIGQMFRALGASLGDSVGVVGLGAGTLAAYGQAGQRWDFYEIDPAVARISTDPRYFTYYFDSPATKRLILGDARLKLRLANSGQYGMLLLDAYSSDAPPVHLMTREALRLYLEKLRPGGIIGFNITNRHLDLERVVAALVRDQKLVGLVREDTRESEQDRREFKYPVVWAVVARQRADLGSLVKDSRWRAPRGNAADRPWTDDYSSIISVLHR